jgi:FMN phosphatase YigB (HAD superfamily)
MSIISETNVEVVVFDLDDVLIHEGFQEPILCDQTLDVLNYLKSKNIKMAIASHNLNAEKIIAKLKLQDYFCLILGYYDHTDKASHLHKIIKDLNIDRSKILFCDDLSENIRQARVIGISTIYVNWQNGILLEDIKSKIF